MLLKRARLELLAHAASSAQLVQAAVAAAEEVRQYEALQSTGYFGVVKSQGAVRQRRTHFLDEQSRHGVQDDTARD